MDDNAALASHVQHFYLQTHHGSARENELCCHLVEGSSAGYTLGVGVRGFCVWRQDCSTLFFYLKKCSNNANAHIDA